MDLACVQARHSVFRMAKIQEREKRDSPFIRLIEDTFGRTELCCKLSDLLVSHVGREIPEENGMDRLWGRRAALRWAWCIVRIPLMPRVAGRGNMGFAPVAGVRVHQGE
jgi:hypothetical protein